MRRVVKSELLDEDLGTPDEIRTSLRDLGRINDWFGGTRTTVRLLQKIAGTCGTSQLSLLEVGAGDGRVPLIAAERLAAKGMTLRVTLLDQLAGHLPAHAVAAVSGDALHLPFQDDSFDVVSCSLLMHHFEPEQVPQFVGEGLRVSRRAVLINDLVRSPAHLALVYCGLPLFRSRITWHDAPASVRRAYTTAEVRETLRGCSAADVSISKHFLYRMGVILWKQRPRSPARHE